MSSHFKASAAPGKNTPGGGEGLGGFAAGLEFSKEGIISCDLKK